MTPPPHPHPVPLCPVTGEPARRLVQRVSAHRLAECWRIIMRVDLRPSFRGATSFDLWESPTGLCFFGRRYARLPTRDYPQESCTHGEIVLTGGLIRDGERVLDVGCGFGRFRLEMLTEMPAAD